MLFAESFLSPLLYGFQKGYNTQRAFLKFLETCKITIDNGDFAGALLMDLSKAFRCVKNIGRSALALIKSYLSNRRQLLKINGSFSMWKETKMCRKARC